MELTQEFIQEHNLSEEQVGAITNYVTKDYLPTIKKDWDDKANRNAEGILAGASKYAQSKFGVALEREQGEKYADYLQRIADASLESQKTSLQQKEIELQDKLKNFKGSEELKQQLLEEKTKNDALLKQVAELEPLKGFDKKYEEAQSQLTSFQTEVSFSNVKPAFPQTVNKFEAEARWNEFKSNTLSKYNVQMVDGIPTAIDKENNYKTIKLSELLESDENIKNLLQGRQQRGTGSSSASTLQVEGIPFDIPEGASRSELSKLVSKHLEKKLGSTVHRDYPTQFRELYAKVVKAVAV